MPLLTALATPGDALVRPLLRIAALALIPCAALAAGPMVDAGRNNTFLIKADGTMWAWGSNEDGKLGDGTDTSIPTPRQVGTFTWISAGSINTSALRQDGSLWSWGANAYSGPGDLSDSTTFRPRQVGTGYMHVAARKHAMSEYTLATRIDGTLWAWGRNSSGQLGDSNIVPAINPKLIGTGFASAAVGAEHSVALKLDGTVWTWGNNAYGQLGNGTTTSASTPRPITGTFTRVAAGANHTVALKADGTLWAWGRNHVGQVGDGSTTDVTTPKQIDAGVTFIAAGADHTVAVKNDGSLWAWGANFSGQLGDGTLSPALRPKAVGSGFASVAAGFAHTVAIKNNGAVWAWGQNSAGQLGDGTTVDSRVPKQIIASTLTELEVFACVQSWAERNFPAIFPPASSTSGTIPGYDYRFYAGTRNYIGQIQATKHLVIYGPVSENALLDLGPLTTWATNAGCL